MGTGRLSFTLSEWSSRHDASVRTHQALRGQPLTSATIQSIGKVTCRSIKCSEFGAQGLYCIALNATSVTDDEAIRDIACGLKT